MRLYIALILFALATCAGAQIPDHNLRDYGAVLDGISANGEDDNALEAAIRAVRAPPPRLTSSRIWWHGVLTLRRPPPSITGCQIEGDSMLSAIVLKAYPGDVLWRLTDVGQTIGGVTALRNFAVPQYTGTPGSYTILARATSTWAPDCLELENLYLGSGTGPGPFRTIELDGTARVTPIGIRQPRVHNVTCFGSSAAANVYFAGTVDLFATCLRVYPAGGTFGDVVWGAGNTGQVVY